MQTLPLHIFTAFEKAECPENLLQGFQKYLKADYEFTHTPYEIVAELFGVSLRYYPSQNKADNSLFIVPSIINGSEVFDLLEEYSFISYATQQNIDIYMIDWGDLSQGFSAGLADLLAHIFMPMWHKANEHSGTPLHVLGYCLGGTLCADFFANSQTNHQPKSLTFLATPFDFSLEDAPWRYVEKNSSNIKSQIRLQQGLTQRMLQSHFLKLHPDYTIQKFQEFYKMEERSLEEKKFVAVERWLNDGFDLPAELSIDIIEHYFVGNKLLDDLRALPKVPFAMISSENDQIVPSKSAQIFQQTYPHVHQITTHCGHVGMMVGRDAKRTVWEPLVSFLSTAALQQN